jgi:hypothetical protein
MGLQKGIMFPAAAALVAGLGLSAAPGARPASAPLLRPLGDADQTATHESGCQLSFNTRGGTFVYAIGHDFMLRTRAGRSVCRISDEEFGALSEGGSRTCGGVRVTIRRTGRFVGNEASDRSSAPAMLTATAGGRTWTVRGYWGTAC